VCVCGLFWISNLFIYVRRRSLPCDYRELFDSDEEDNLGPDDEDSELLKMYELEMTEMVDLDTDEIVADEDL
jgi:hypothetical protein